MFFAFVSYLFVICVNDAWALLASTGVGQRMVLACIAFSIAFLATRRDEPEQVHTAQLSNYTGNYIGVPHWWRGGADAMRALGVPDGYVTTVDMDDSRSRWKTGGLLLVMPVGSMTTNLANQIGQVYSVPSLCQWKLTSRTLPASGLVALFEPGVSTPGSLVILRDRQPPRWNPRPREPARDASRGRTRTRSRGPERSVTRSHREPTSLSPP